MRSVLRILGYVVGVAAVVIAIAAVAVYMGSNGRVRKSYAVTPRPVAIPSDAVTIARGKYLAETRGCNECHGKDFGGSKVIDDTAMGTLHGPNLTRGKGSRVATFKDEDWVRAIRHGVGPDGRGLFLMP